MVGVGAASGSEDVQQIPLFVETSGQRRISKTRLKVHAQPALPFGDLLFLARKPAPHFEHLAGIKAGVFRTRSLRRLTEDRSWSAETDADMEWTLWRTAETTTGRCPKAAVTMNEPLWNALQSTAPRRIVNHHRDQLEPRLDWRRELDQMPRRTPGNLLVLRKEGHHCDRRTRVLRNNHQWTIQRRLTQGAHSHHLLAFRYHPLLLRHPRLHLTRLERWRQLTRSE